MPILHAILSALILLAFVLGGCGGSKPYAPKTPSYEPAYPQNQRAQTASVSTQSGSAMPEAAHADGDTMARETRSIAQEPRERPGLGTRFGESRRSSVTQKRFERASNSPFAQVALHYNNLAGIQAQSWSRGTSLSELRAQTPRGGISISLVDENGRLLQGGTGAGRTYVVGRDGQRYSMHIRNDTGGTYEMVSSVDGLDVVDGKPASFGKRGYILAPYSTLVVEGFRTSEDAVAAFRFGAVRDSYAARTSGDRNVGVIGFAFFAERGSRWTTDQILRRETANPFPGGFAEPPAVVR